MAMNRGHGQPWEIRLGAVQAVIWVGLAVGSMAGAYFVGFFSGRYVGYETARSASAVEVAKLAVTDRLLEAPADEASDIYDRLNRPAMLDEGTGGVNVASTTKPGARGQTGASVQNPAESQAARIAQEIRSGAPIAPPPEAGKADAFPKASDVESLFEEPGSPIESTDTLLAAAADADLSSRQQVRVLGGGNGPQGSDKAIGLLLEERLAAARATQEKSAATKEPARDSSAVKKPADPKPSSEQKAADAKPAAPKVEAKPEVKTATSKPEPSSFARQVVPAGYFAQVAAPTKMGDAEEIAKRLKRSGFPVVIETANVRGENYYRVLVGPENDKGTADRLVGQLQRERFLTGAPFIRRIK